MSKLIDKLRRISQGAPQPMGFRASIAAQNQPMLLVAAFQPEDIAGIKEVIGEVDALVISLKSQKEKSSTLGQVSEIAKEIPWGEWSSGITEEKIKDLEETGADFFVFDARIPGATVQGREKIGKILRIDPAWSDTFIRTVEQLPVDAMLLDEREEPLLTLLQLMQCQRLTNLMTKPLLVATPSELKKEDLKSLWEAGVSGIVMETGKDYAVKLREWRQAIAALPAATRRQRRKAEPLLPPVASPSPAKEEEEEEE